MLHTEPLPETPEPVQPVRHELDFASATFRHGDRTVIDDLSLSLRQGQRLAVVGPSGSGKSTLLQLLARFYDVHAGAVRVGGVDVRAVNSEVPMAQFAIVFQDVYLFDGTIEENVRPGRPDADGADVRPAAPRRPLRRLLGHFPDAGVNPFRTCPPLVRVPAERAVHGQGGTTHDDHQPRSDRSPARGRVQLAPAAALQEPGLTRTPARDTFREGTSST